MPITLADILKLERALNTRKRLVVEAEPGPVAWADVTGKPATFAPVIGGGSGDAVAGNDARLTDARTPTSHAHPISQVTDLQTTLDGKQALGTYATLTGGKVPTAQLGGGTPDATTFLRGDQTYAAPPGGGADPPHYGAIAGAMGDGDPNMMLLMMQQAGVVSPTPTNLTASVARCCSFRLPFNLTVNRIRFYGVGATTGIYRVAIYRYSDKARLAVFNDFNTAAATWGNLGSALGLSLVSGTLYFVAVAVDTTGTTAGILSMGATIAASTGQVNTAPQSLPGNLDLDAGKLSKFCFQFAVTTGALPDPAPTLAAPAAWTGGMPAFFLDNADV